MEEMSTKPDLNSHCRQSIVSESPKSCYNISVNEIYYSDDDDEKVFAEEDNQMISIECSGEDGDELSMETLTLNAKTAHEVFVRHLMRAFNDPNDSDLRFKADDKIIYCHKTVLLLRNGKFWQFLCQTKGPNDEILINPETYQTIYAFLQYLYGIADKIDVRFAKDLQNMAKLFDEPELEDQCSQLIQNSEINESNVCPLYEKAITEGLTDLEKSCVEFAANNWRNVCESEAFKTLDDKLMKRLIVTVLEYP